tara:strand:- start:9714 stop:10337 length:624 start_codon:yes stop_codon:yes gene_type:complete
MDHHDLKNMRTLDRLNCVQPHDVVVDVGACDGTYIRYFGKKLLGTGKIYCVELSKSNYSHLVRTFFGQPNILGVNAAISDENGTLQFYKGDTPEQFNIVGHDTSHNKQEVAGVVPCVRLDTLLADEPKIKIVKIDVEGAEAKVLKGMKGIVSNVECILLENHFDEDWPEIRKILIEDYGFTCYNMETDEKLDMESPRPYQCLCQRKI